MEGSHQAFWFKLKASRYHFDKMRYYYTKYYYLLENFLFDDKFLPAQRLHTFFFHYDGFLYELNSCFDMLLQSVILKWSIGIPKEHISWNNEVKKVLREKSITDYLSMISIVEEEWFKNLKIARNHVTHHERPAICGSYDGNNVLCLHFCISGLDDKRCFFKECDLWGSQMSELFKKLDLPGS